MTTPETDAACIAAARTLVRMSLAEDLSSVGDITSESTIPADLTARVQLVSRQAGVLSGLTFASLVFAELPGAVTVTPQAHDGDRIEPRQVLASFDGPVRTLLTGERTVLNLLTHLSGVATRAAAFVDAVRGTRAVILDTRKTLPGYRALQKYAVRCGGGTNHRMGLFDGLLIKDNHLAARGDSSCASAVADARQFLRQRGLTVGIEIEVDSLDQLRDALRERPDIVLLDNMPPDMLREAVTIRDSVNSSTLLEASGGVSLATVRAIAEAGVDRISIGALTHSSPALDLGFDWPW